MKNFVLRLLNRFKAQTKQLNPTIPKEAPSVILVIEEKAPQVPIVVELRKVSETVTVDPKIAQIDAECARMQSNSKEVVDLNYLHEYAPVIFGIISGGKKNMTTSNYKIAELQDRQNFFQITKL